MVDAYGNWTEEKDYNTYPEEKLCDCDRMAIIIRLDGYEPKTSMENLVTMIYLHAKSAVEDGTDILLGDPNDIVWWVKENGGYEEFDYWA